MNANPAEVCAPYQVDRRTAIKWMMTAAASATLLDSNLPAADVAARASGMSYGQDPDLLKTYRPGDLWPLTFTASQRVLAASLCDAIIPADAKSPAASAVGVPAFIDEWISAPYPGHDTDRRIVLEGFTWLDVEAQKRFQNSFTNLVASQKNTICQDICLVAKAAAQFRVAAEFFKRYRDLTAGGFYTTPEGMKDIGYVGNTPMATYAGPPAEALNKLGLA